MFRFSLRSTAGKLAGDIPLLGQPSQVAVGAKGRAWVGGELVSIQIGRNQHAEASGAFRPMPGRDILPSVWDRLRLRGVKVEQRFHTSVFEAKRLRVCTLIEAYREWGRNRRNGKEVLIGGMSTRDGTELSIDIVVFNDGAIEVVEDNNLDHHSSELFRISADTFINQLRERHKTSQIYLAAPLEDWRIKGVTYIGADALAKGRFLPLKSQGEKGSHFVAPMVLASAGIGIFFAVCIWSWSKFSNAADAYHKAESAGEIASRGGRDLTFLTETSERDDFMNAERSQETLARMLTRVTRGVGSIEGAQILEFKTPGDFAVRSQDQGSNRPSLRLPVGMPCFTLRVSLPAQKMSAWEQAQSAIPVLAAATQSNLRLVPASWADAGDRKSMTVEGFIPGLCEDRP